ncbi:hypothetical protein NKJ19_32065 [Mesorhizobium sp. M0203]
MLPQAVLVLRAYAHDLAEGGIGVNQLPRSRVYENDRNRMIVSEVSEAPLALLQALGCALLLGYVDIEAADARLLLIGSQNGKADDKAPGIVGRVA